METMMIETVLDALRIRFRPWIRFFYPVLTGFGGNAILFLFLTTFLHFFEAMKFAPWIIAFNTAATGFGTIDKERFASRYRFAAAAAAGILNTGLTVVALTLAGRYFLGETYLAGTDLLLFFCVGAICSVLGALLAIRYYSSQTEQG